MLILLNSTKTMDLKVDVPGWLSPTEPIHLAEAGELAGPLAKVSLAWLGDLMAVKGKLADQTRVDLALWGKKDRLRKPAFLAFTGLVYKYLDAPSLTVAQWNRAQKTVRILSGLYGLLRPLDEVEAYRLEMGSKVKPKGAKNLAAFWRDRLTDAVNAELKDGEPVISPVFKERLPDGTFRTAPVHSKMARGALARFALMTAARTPDNLLGFGEMGWETFEEPPVSGPWLFVRNHRG